MNIELKSVTKKYEKSPLPVLDSVSLKLKGDESLAIVGPSGSGKSTLLNLMGTLDLPGSGEVLLNGVSTAAMSAAELVKVRNIMIGFVFQTHLLLPQLCTLENVLMPVLTKDNGEREKAVARAKELLGFVGLSEKIHSYPGEMSVGECQRVAVVRALINGPELLLADEPTGSLDHDSAERLIDLLIGLKKDRKFTLVAVTHSTELASRMDTTYRLVNGKIEMMSI